MHSERYFHYEIDKLLSLIDLSIEKNEMNLKNLYTEITLLDETRKQTYRDFLNESLIDILDDYGRKYNSNYN